MADTTSWGALGVALYAAGLSTYNLAVRRKEQQRLLLRDVRVTGGMRYDTGEPITTIRAANQAVRAVEIVRVGVVVSTGLHVFHPPAQNLPARLEDGQSVTVELQPHWLELVRGSTRSEITRIVTEDSLGNVYYSDPIALPDEAQASLPTAAPEPAAPGEQIPTLDERRRLYASFLALLSELDLTLWVGEVTQAGELMDSLVRVAQQIRESGSVEVHEATQALMRWFDQFPAQVPEEIPDKADYVARLYRARAHDLDALRQTLIGRMHSDLFPQSGTI